MCASLNITANGSSRIARSATIHFSISPAAANGTSCVITQPKWRDTGTQASTRQGRWPRTPGGYRRSSRSCLATARAPKSSTGSVFEADEGQRDGAGATRLLSAYGLSKTLTYQAFKLDARRAGLHLGKFVIPNPFGPMEEPRYTSYLITAWLRGDVPTVRTPDYVRDNIHVSLLAKCYADFATTRPLDPGVTHLGPSGYRETQGDFTRRVAREMRPRLDCECAVEVLRQEDFPEPRVRVNPDRVAPGAFDLTEQSAWDALAEFYLSTAVA